MTTLITGGTGLLGAAVAKRLVEHGERPVLLDAAPNLARLEGFADRVTVVRGDVRNLHALLHVAREHRATRLLHLAYLMGPDSDADPLGATQVNVLGTLNAFEAARVLSLERVCLASSIAVFGNDGEYPPEAFPLGEDAGRLLALGIPVYSAGKLYAEVVGELYAQRYGVFLCGLRPGVVYGYGRSAAATAFSGDLISRPALGEAIRVENGDSAVSMLYVEDVADQFVALLSAARSKIRRRFYNTGGDRVTVREIAETVRRVLPEARITVVPGGGRNVAGLASDLSDAELVRDIGVRRRYTPLELGVRAMIDETRRRHGLPPVV